MYFHGFRGAKGAGEKAGSPAVKIKEEKLWACRVWRGKPLSVNGGEKLRVPFL